MSTEKPISTSYGHPIISKGYGAKSMSKPGTTLESVPKPSQREKKRQLQKNPSPLIVTVSSASNATRLETPAWSKTTEPVFKKVNSPRLPVQTHKPEPVVPNSSNAVVIHDLLRNSPTKSEPNDTASAMGAAVIIPVRASMLSSGAMSRLSPRGRRSSGTHDTPWTNYASASSSVNNLFRVDQQDKLGDESGIMLTKFCETAYQNSKPSFSIIQDQQTTESNALRGKLKPSLVKIQEEENLRQQEKRKEQQFLKWFEEESRRTQQKQKNLASKVQVKSTKSRNVATPRAVSAPIPANQRSTGKSSKKNAKLPKSTDTKGKGLQVTDNTGMSGGRTLHPPTARVD